jgi:hypothetical protein
MMQCNIDVPVTARATNAFVAPRDRPFTEKSSQQA